MARTLTIGLVFDDSLDKPDGVQQYVLTLGEWLRTRGYRVHYLVGETTRRDLENLHSLSRNVRVAFNGNRMAMPLPARIGPIRELLEKEQFDVLHVQVPYSPALAGRVIAAAGPHTAVVGTFHILPNSRVAEAANKLLAAWTRRTLARFDAMLATSQAAADFAGRITGHHAEAQGLPLAVSRFAAARPFKKYQKDLTVVFMGRLVERKGCTYLLKAVDHAVRDGSWPENARVVVCGGGPLETELKRYAWERDLEDKVEFTGYFSEEDKPRYLAGADVVVYPSTGGESFGTVLLEAMAATPGMVLAGNNAGYASVLAAHPESLFDPKQTAAFADKLVQALKDPQARRAAGAWQKAFVADFDVDKVGERLVQAYTGALRKRRH